MYNYLKYFNTVIKIDDLKVYIKHKDDEKGEVSVLIEDRFDRGNLMPILFNKKKLEKFYKEIKKYL